MSQSRVPEGVPTGGQFAASSRPESNVSLDLPQPDVASMATKVAALLGNREVTPGTVATALRSEGCELGDSQVLLQVFEAVKQARPATGRLAILAAHEDPRVRAAVARNPNVPLHVLRTLADTDDETIRMQLASNPNADANLLADLAETALKDGQGTGETRRQTLQNAASHPNASPETLDAIACAPSPLVNSEVLRNLLGNPNVSAPTLAAVVVGRRGEVGGYAFTAIMNLEW